MCRSTLCLYCISVLKELENPDVMGQAKNPAATLMFGKSVINFSLDPDDPLAVTFHRPVPSHGEPPIDISIASIKSQWEFIQSRGKKAAIDLDVWEEPPWSEIQMCMAVGYLNEGKQAKGDRVLSKRLMLVAEMASSPDSNSREFTLCSSLDDPHGHFFSGISGGPILAQVKDEAIYPIGIIQEASPSSSKHTRQTGEFTSPLDVLVRGILLTRQRFLSWLSLTPLGH